MKIKNNLFTASNLLKLGYLLAFVFILGCGGGGSGGTASSPGTSSDRDPGSITGTSSEGEGGSGGTGSGGEGEGDGIKILTEEEKIFALTQAEVNLNNPITLELEIVAESTGSGNFYLKIKEPVSENFYTLPHKPGQIDFLISLGLVTVVVIENKTVEEFKILLAHRSFALNEQSLKADAAIQFYIKRGHLASAQEYASQISFPIKLSGKVSGTGADIIPFQVHFGPIFQVKISENLASQDLIFHSNLDKYIYYGGPLNISGGFVRLEGTRPIYILNDTPIARKITFNIFSKYVLRFWDRYREALYPRGNQDSTGFSGGSYTFELTPNQGEFFSFGQFSSSIPIPEDADAIMKIETLGELPVSIDLLKLFRSYHYGS